ncbi:hypothetical protein [Peribacillus frigoritolerans]|uniref:hypothetical protein n=1 Tax=Peribacillus frigoritolerans TaxID=450367 RepID=UPI001059AC53|nr:hypothetical protein [Peribacillus frigoritolerans]TDL80873.1 hypothetical protein E2R53_12895 [Peribacillus frigoritolerans]
MLKKIVLTLIVSASIFLNFTNVSAHNLGSKGSESAGYLYVGSHWPSRSTNYSEATSDTWENRFKSGVSKFKNENIGYSITEVSSANSSNFIESYSAPSATWVAQRTFYGISNDHPTRWRIQYNSAKSANSWTTVGAHEIGHIYGLADLYEDRNSSKLMYGYDNGVRYTQSSDKTGFSYIYGVLIASNVMTSSTGELSQYSLGNIDNNDEAAREKVKELNEKVINGEEKIIDVSAMFPEVSKEEAFEEADLVIKGSVKSIKSEYMENIDIPFTDFIFEVDDYWKNVLDLNDPENLIITQDGNSVISFNKHPLMKVGEEYFLFLKRIIDSNNQGKFILIGGPNGNFALEKGIIQEEIDIQSVNGESEYEFIRNASNGEIK